MIGATKRYTFACLIVAFALVLAFIGYSWFTSRTLVEDPKVDPVKPNTVQVDHKDTKQTTYQYVPKVSPTDNDVEFVSSPKPIVVSVNGKRHEVEHTVKEEHKLDKGKLVVTEERQVVLDLKVPEQPRFKKGVYIDTDKKVGVRASYQAKEFDIDLKADVWAKDKNADKRITLTATKWF